MLVGRNTFGVPASDGGAYKPRERVTSAALFRLKPGLQTLRRTAAFSLVEIVCAIAILGIGLFGLMQGITAALKASKDSELQTAAALIAAAQIESFRADGFILEGETEGQCQEGLDLYQWRQSVTKSDLDGLYEVSVVIENANSGQAIYELKTLLFDPPLATFEDSTRRKDPSKKREGRR